MLVIARNASGRPTLQHFLLPSGMTACGLDSRIWPRRAYPKNVIKELYCMRCAAVSARSKVLAFAPRLAARKRA